LSYRLLRVFGSIRLEHESRDLEFQIRRGYLGSTTGERILDGPGGKAAPEETNPFIDFIGGALKYWVSSNS
jgi:hypothetical protein